MLISNRTRYILTGLGAALLLFLAWYFSTIVTYLIISAILSTIGRPLVRWLRSLKLGKLKISSTLSAFITLFTLWLLFIGFFRFMIPLVISEFRYLANVDYVSFLKSIEEPINSITNLLYKESVSLTDESFMVMVGEKIAAFLKFTQLSDLFGAIAGTLGSLMMGFFSVSFITFFFLKEEGMFKNGLLVLTPKGYESRFAKSFDRITYLLRRYFIGLVLEVLMVGTLDAVGLLIIGLPFRDAVVIGLICGLINVIPYLGPWIGAGIGLLIGLVMNLTNPFMEQTLPLLAYMTLVFTTVQIIDNVIFQPLIYSSSVKAHPLEIFLVIIGAGSVAGILGMILAIPVYTILRVFAAEFLSEMKIVQKITANMGDATNKHNKEEAH